MTKHALGPQGPLESRLEKTKARRQGSSRLDMAIVLGIKPHPTETTLATSSHRPPFFPCCVCSTILDFAQPVHVCANCRRTHCEGCGTWMEDGSRKCINCFWPKRGANSSHSQPQSLRCWQPRLWPPRKE